MRANAMCISCLLGRQEKIIRNFADEDKKSRYIHQVLEVLYQYGQTESSPQLAERINRLYEQFWGNGEDFSQVKHLYNQLLLKKEQEIGKLIQAAEDPVRECIKYVSAGNYIDFSAVENVNEETFEQLMQKVQTETVPREEYLYFTQDLQKAKNLVYLVDNCGEIVLDKLFIGCLKEKYPKLNITVIVRGKPVINDATMDDVREVGLTDLVTCIGNGNGAPGTVPDRLSDEALQILKAADVVISKGQGNFESLMGEGINPYYIFLCKCELFVHRFGLKRYESVFAKEERLQTNK